MICRSEATVPFLILNCLTDPGEALSRDHSIPGSDGASWGGAPQLLLPLSCRKMETLVPGPGEKGRRRMT